MVGWVMWPTANPLLHPFSEWHVRMRRLKSLHLLGSAHDLGDGCHPDRLLLDRVLGYLNACRGAAEHLTAAQRAETKVEHQRSYVVSDIH